MAFPCKLTLHRYTDFLVNEILPSGQVLHLNSVKVPKKPSAAVDQTQTKDMSPASSKPASGDNEKSSSLPLPAEISNGQINRPEDPKSAAMSPADPPGEIATQTERNKFQVCQM